MFPLPTSSDTFSALFPEVDPGEMDWMRCVSLSLNSMWGGDVGLDREPNGVQRKCLAQLLQEVRRFCQVDSIVERFDWSEFFSIRSVDYRGDEVKVARRFRWVNIAPALPREIGKVPLSELCTHGSKFYVDHFDQFLKPPTEWGKITRPKVMVDDESWGEVCVGLVKSGVCTWIEESEVFHPGDEPLLNGLFGVSKEDWTEAGDEIFRLIMNLVPLNSLCLPLSGDVQTLPSWSGMSPFFLQPSQNLLITSEDVKCFFYTMAVPPAWVKYLAFNKEVPDMVLPTELRGRRVYLASLVLPMGFLNSVSLAQHVHRNLVLASGGDSLEVNAPEAEIRKDRAFTTANPSWRVYLDNYDLLEKVEATSMVEVQGTSAPGVLSLRNEYEKWEVPRNVKKSVSRQPKAELQGATVDGILGVAYPREAKLCKYLAMAWELAQAPRARLRQWQVVCGGLVYFAMFRRPLLGGLNAVWRHIESYEGVTSQWQTTPADCRLELLRFLGALPLARLDFRLDMHDVVTCSDASSSGGGICASHSLTPFGSLVVEGHLRGDVPEQRNDLMVVTVGLFDGLGALRVCHEVLGIQVLGHVSVERAEPARRVVEAHFPGSIMVPDVEMIDSDMVRQWSLQFSQCALVLLGAGPPCQGVSGFNADRKGALKDGRSSLFSHVPRVRDLLKQHFRWCPVYTIMESVASMDSKDRHTMTQGIGVDPVACNAGTMTWCHRPRLYWFDWDLRAGEGAEISPGDQGSPAQVVLTAHQPIDQVVRKGWLKVAPDQAFPTFTTSRPQSKPGRKPAGLAQCTDADVARWQADAHRYPPYQYREVHCLVNRSNQLRVPDVSERELMLGFPLHYTAACATKRERKRTGYSDLRLTLLGNTLSVPVVAWILGQLYGILGFRESPTPQQVIDSLLPGASGMALGKLVRLPLNPLPGASSSPMYDLASSWEIWYLSRGKT